MDGDSLDADDQWLYGDAPDIPRIEEPANVEDALPVEAPRPRLVAPENDEVKPPGTENDDTDEPVPEEERENNDDASFQATNGVVASDEMEKDDEQDDDREEGETGNNSQVEDGEIEKAGSDKEDSDVDDDSDDDINVVIGNIDDIKSGAPGTYQSGGTALNIKRSGLMTSAGDKSKTATNASGVQSGKFTVDEFDQMGTINGVPATEYNLDSLEDKPWRKPGADITDYFNYGFNEDTWRAYCERQKRMRVSESGVGIAPLNALGMTRTTVPILNDNSKYTGVGTFAGIRKAGPPPGRRMMGPIDVIGSSANGGIVGANKSDAPKENVIEVMTADRREYSRKPGAGGFPDMSMPPPGAFVEFHPPDFSFNPEPEPFYGGGYEPTQDMQQWSEPPPNLPPPVGPPNTGPPPPGGMWGVPPPVGGHPPTMVPPPLASIMSTGGRGGVGVDSDTPPPSSTLHAPRSRSGSPNSSVGGERINIRRGASREPSRSRSEKPRDRDRERSHRRERSRSRSRRHKSRSRSPSHRSHRKKKSRRHEESE